MEPVRDPEGIEIGYLHRLADLRDRMVLEIGSGDGRLTWRYANLTAIVAGIDPDADHLAAALASRPRTMTTPLLLAQAQAEHLPFRDEQFGAVILAWSL
jgi:ubiquinone/menaquinone biosynthesis C-methylase UbiE